MTIEILPIRGVPEVRPGDDLGAILADRIRGSGVQVRRGDVIVVTQKVVSKAEGRVVSELPDGKAAWVRRETRRVVARRGDLVIAETKHGFVCANAGVDASNVGEGFLTLLPEDPDGSAERLRAFLSRSFAVPMGVVVTDTFGRPWRHGVLNVAIGCAGLPSLVDLRGTKDASGRVLDATIVALADEVAAASGLAIEKANGVPAVVVRGVQASGYPTPAATLVRGPEEDLFRESPLQAITAGVPAGRFGPGPGGPNGLREALREAVSAVCGAAATDGPIPWSFVALDSPPGRKRLVEALAAAGAPSPLAGLAPAIIVPFARPLDGERLPRGRGDGAATRDGLLVAGGAVIRDLRLALRALGLASAWEPSALRAPAATREALAVDHQWIPLGCVAAGPPAPDENRSAEQGDHSRWSLDSDTLRFVED